MYTYSLTPNLDPIISPNTVNLAHASRHRVKTSAAIAMHTWEALSDLHTFYPPVPHTYGGKEASDVHVLRFFLPGSFSWN